jgi:hypothetical protein
MDWDINFLRDLTIELEYMKNNESIAIVTTWVGYIGVLTGVSINKYSISINSRKSNYAFWSNLYRTINMCYPISFIIREVFENKMNYKEMCQKLESVYLISPCYITICSPLKTESKIIIRDVYYTETELFGEKLIQTNIDSENDTSQNILYSSERIALTKKLLNNNNNNFESNEDLLNTLNKYPIINEETVYITLLDPTNYKSYTYLNI